MLNNSLVFVVVTALSLFADEVDVFDMGFDELKSIKVEVASRQKESISDVPATVRIVTADMIKQRGYMTIEEILADQPGFQFRNINGFNSYTFMRGSVSQNNHILMLVDGVQINELNSGGYYGGVHYNLFNVKQVEILYGPASALYGTNAISGIINIVTYSPKERAANENEVEVAYGSFDTGLAAFRSGDYDVLNEFGYTLSGHYVTTEKADLGGANGDNNWYENMENFEDSFSLEGKISYKMFDFGFLFQDKQASRSTNYKSVGTAKRDYGTLWHISFLNAWAKHQLNIDDTKKLVSKLYYRNATVHDDTIAYIDETPAPGQQVGYFRPNWLVGLDEQLQLKYSDSLHLTLGLSAEHEELSKEFSKTYSTSAYLSPAKPSRPSMLPNNLLSSYVQLKYALTEALNVTAGLRYDKSSYYGEVATPRLAFVYTHDKGNVKLLYSEAFRAPKPWDYNYGTGNSALNPEKIKSYELAGSYQLNNRLYGELSLYHNIIDDKLVKQSTPLKWINSGELKTYGLEVDLRYRRSAFEGYANYTYTNSKDENKVQIDEIAEHAVNIGLNYTYDQHWKFDLRGNYVGSRKNPQLVASTQSYTIEPYMLVNGQISYLDLNGFDLHLIVKNLLDEAYYHTSNLTVSRFRQAQQTVIMKASYAF